jgi:hypothetical protein
LSCFFLAACGGSISEDKFLDKLAQKTCDLAFECADEKDIDPKFNDEGECVEFIKGLTQPQGDNADCEYDGDAANDCLDAIDELECDDDAEDIPECDDVYSAGCG